VKIIIRDLQKKTFLNPNRIKKLVLNVLSGQGSKKSGEITVCLVGDREIRRLNLEFLGKDCPTDVIAFDLNESKDKIAADIVVSTDTAYVNAKRFGTSPVYEVYLYIVHGLLHIFGYDDKNSGQRRLMQHKAESILRNFKV